MDNPPLYFQDLDVTIQCMDVLQIFLYCPTLLAPVAWIIRLLGLLILNS